MAVAFTAVVAALSWGLLVAAVYLPGIVPPPATHLGLLAYGLFLVVLVAARAMAIQLLPDTTVALDTGFYVAAAACLGTGPAGRLVAIALTVDALSRVLRAQPGHRRGALIHALYYGSMSGALLLVVGVLFELDALYGEPGIGDGVVVLRVVLAGLTFLVAHYAIQGVRLALAGHATRDLVRRMVLPGIAAEAALLPLAAIIVFIYDPDQPLRFALLGTTYLIVDYAFSRMAAARASLERRVAELETLNVVAHRLGTSLQVRDLVEIIAREICGAIEGAAVVVVARRDGPDQLVLDAYDRARDGFTRERGEVGRGLVGRVMTSGQPLRVADLREVPELEPPGGHVRAYLGVPLDIYGQVEGVLALQSDVAGAFSADDERLLRAIAAQVAAALENARLYELAMVDGLTGLFVRRYFDARLAEEIERARRFGNEFSVVMMDLDDFKRLNDTRGHAAGDRVLRAVAEVVRAQMRAIDTAARVGGEEFAFILPRTAMVDAYSQAERVRRAIEELRLAEGDDVIRMTASFGIASFPDSGAADAEALLRLADTALYRAKRTGKNRVELYWTDGGASERSA